MAFTKSTIFGAYKDRASLESAVDMLKLEGFSQSDISVMFPKAEDAQKFAEEKHTKAPEGAMTGAGAGMAIGGTLGWLIGIGSLAIPGVGPLVAAGPIMAALAGAGVGGAVGTISGGLIGMGIPEYEAKRIEDYVKKGGYLLSVHSDQSDWMERAEKILKRTDADSITKVGPVFVGTEREEMTGGLRTEEERLRELERKGA